MSIELYYTAPPDDVFEEIKAGAIELWRTFNNDYGYVTEKLAAVEHVTNVADNWMYLVAMFDQGNQARLLARLRPGTVALVLEAMDQ